MNLLGIDLGALATKTAVVIDDRLVGWAVIPNEGRLAEAAEQSRQMALAGADLRIDQVDLVGGTGWGRRYIPFDHCPLTVINCLARGAKWAAPEVRTILDLGGLSTTVLGLDADGRVVEYRTNDRCASGTGFYLELAAQALELAVEEMGPVSLAARGRAHISGQCAVFGESEIVSHVNDGADVADIVAGIAFSIGSGAATTARRLGVEPALVLTGGVSKHQGVVATIKDKLGVDSAALEVDPQLIGAIGAALLAVDKREVAN